MKTSIFKSFLFITLSIGILSGCVNDDDYSIPALECVNPDIMVNKTVQDIYNQARVAPVQYTSNDYIEAYIVSSDKRGNFFKTLHLQAVDNSIAFTILADYSNLATLYQPGRKVFIKLTGLYIQIKDGGLVVGGLNGTNVGRISQFDTPKAIVRDCNIPDNEEQLVQHITMTEALSSDTYLNKLIEFDEVQFKDDAVGEPYFIAGTSGTNRDLTDKNGNVVTIRSTSYTKFGFETVPKNSGKIRGILTRFGTTYQFTPRYESDIQLTETRFRVSTALGGTTIQYQSNFTENFENYTPTTILPEYINDNTIGGRYWQVKKFPSTGAVNNFLEVTSFGGGGGTTKSYFFVPVNFTNANTFSFKTLVRYYKGAVLRVYYVTTTDYTAGGAIDLSKFTDITSNFVISTAGDNGSTFAFLPSGDYTIPATLTGNGYFVFEYAGTPTVTTTMQIDDIVVK